MNRLTRYVVPIFAVVSLFTASGSDTAARQSEGTFDLSVIVVTCEREPTGYPFEGGDCIPSDHVSIVVTSTNGEPLGTCITSTANGDVVAGCTISVPAGMTVTVTEDLDTVRPGYAPTLNPQSFEVPVFPPDGVFGGPVFLNLPTENTSTADADTMSRDVELVGEAQSWIVPFEPGWGDTASGRLMLGTQVKNTANVPVLIEVIFSATTADGAPIQCSGLAGPNIWETIAPHEAAFLTCTGPVVPNTLEDVRVLAQLWNADPFSTRPAAFTVSETTFAPSPALSSPMETVYEASTLISSNRPYNVDATLLFRFYDADGMQVGTCPTDWVTASPDFTSKSPVRIRSTSIVGGHSRCGWKWSQVRRFAPSFSTVARPVAGNVGNDRTDATKRAITETT